MGDGPRPVECPPRPREKAVVRDQRNVADEGPLTWHEALTSQRKGEILPKYSNRRMLFTEGGVVLPDLFIQCPNMVLIGEEGNAGVEWTSKHAT